MDVDNADEQLSEGLGSEPQHDEDSTVCPTTQAFVRIGLVRSHSSAEGHQDTPLVISHPYACLAVDLLYIDFFDVFFHSE